MLDGTVVAKLQSVYKVGEDLSRVGAIPLAEYITQCRVFVVDNMSAETSSSEWDSEKRHMFLIGLIKDFVNRHLLPVEGYVTKMGTVDKGALLTTVIETVTGLGILKDAFEDPDVDEIQINDYRTIFVVKRGVTQPLIDKNGRVLQFFSDDEIYTLYHKLADDGAGHVAPFTEGVPIVNIKTAKEGYRISGVHNSANAAGKAPYNMRITSLVIRKFPEIKLTLNDIVKSHTLTPKMARFITLLGKADATLFCVGKTGSGKTTLLNIMGGAVPKNKRIVLVQNPTEIMYGERDEYGRNIRNVVHWEVGEVAAKRADDASAPTMENLMSNTLRFTPELTIIGEARTGGEFSQVLRSTQMGQPCWGTFHASNSEEAMGRMATEVGGDETAVLKKCTKYIDFIISQHRFADGTRRVLEISK